MQYKTAEFYRYNAATLASNRVNDAVILSDSNWNFTVLHRFFNVVYFLLLPATSYLIYAALRKRNQDDDHCVFAGITLVLCFLFTFFGGYIFLTDVIDILRRL